MARLTFLLICGLLPITGMAYSFAPMIRSAAVRPYRRLRDLSATAAASTPEGGGGATGARIEFMEGVEEYVPQEVRLKRAPDGTVSTATFIWNVSFSGRAPSRLMHRIDGHDKSKMFADLEPEMGNVQGMYLIDEEGVQLGKDVRCTYVDGEPTKMTARFVMYGQQQWDRFMRFMERYSKSHNMGYSPPSAASAAALAAVAAPK
ncbi:unnamed protein product [Vitrella brassicaformis CCMP3155]|uniref:Photosystem II reaction center Psb28 protein n=1 Tax=Vitrella brassicaformis (strain CCMP3155) TaxID=1169540 RepID=A0A0G4FP01_VITBC|nr:unnamed protein product [Vitrella brassicaformis CCMP3155]|eukprot:CEM15541.1 unnamed protein product [Vitrella brassicaformis CCMP3155]